MIYIIGIIILGLIVESIDWFDWSKSEKKVDTTWADKDIFNDPHSRL